MWRLPIPTLFPYTTLFRSHQALQPARLRVQRRQAHELSLDLFPVGQGVEQEALIPIDGRDELPLAPRSEEHTSELQSPCNLVCRLLLEKKKKIASAFRHKH